VLILLEGLLVECVLDLLDDEVFDVVEVFSMEEDLELVGAI